MDPLRAVGLTAGAGTFTPPGWRRVLFGAGARRRLPEAIAQQGARRTILVTTRTVHRATSLVDEFWGLLGSGCVGVFDQTAAHTPAPSIFALADLARELSADGFVVLGGSSAVDTSKGAALALALDLRDEEQLRRHVLPADNPDQQPELVFTSPPVPQFAVTTTLAGSEYSAIAGITHERDGVKLLYGERSFHFYTIAIDPEVTLATPRELWMSGGVKVMENAVEEICSVNSMPLTTALALRGLTQMKEALVQTDDDPDDLVPRLAAQQAALMVIFGIHNTWAGVGAALRHMLGARYGILHGHGSCVLAPHLLDFTRSATAAKQAEIARALGAPEDETASAAFRRVVTDLGMPTRLRDLGIPRDGLGEIATDALRQFVTRYSPVAANGPSLTALLERAW